MPNVRTPFEKLCNGTLEKDLKHVKMFFFRFENKFCFSLGFLL